ncbi:MAG: sugar phosphate nucleotidyltransferase [Candidatus Eiseniibacteriota bacterium]
MTPVAGTKAIIPVAGVGSRLRPHTHTTPKALIHVAGKPILAHILDDLERLGVTDVVLVVGHMGEHIREYVDASYSHLTRSYVDQPERMGLGHAVRLTKSLVRGHPAFIVLGDTIFRGDLTGILAGGESRIGVKEVEDPRRFGIVEVKDGYAVRLVEKPDRPTSNLAIVGVYYMTDTVLLFDALDALVEKDLKTKGEYQLTDALQIMIERGHKIRPFPVEGWYDCGKTETLLETNRDLLELRPPLNGVKAPAGTVFVPPVAVDPSAVIESSIVGPHVSIAARAVVREAVVRNSIVNQDAVVEQILLEGSVIGENALVRGTYRHLNVGDSSEVRMG